MLTCRYKDYIWKDHPTSGRTIVRNITV